MQFEAQPELWKFCVIRSEIFFAGLALLCRERSVLQRKLCQIFGRFLVKRDISTARF